MIYLIINATAPLIILQVFYKRDKAVSLSVKNAVTR